jgi:hypothetical protein
MGQPLIRVEVVADDEGMKVRLTIAPSVLTEVYARDGLGLFNRDTANLAVALHDRRDGRSLERRPVVVEFAPGSEDAEEYAPKFRPRSAFELSDPEPQSKA